MNQVLFGAVLRIYKDYQASPPVFSPTEEQAIKKLYTEKARQNNEKVDFSHSMLVWLHTKLENVIAESSDVIYVYTGPDADAFEKIKPELEALEQKYTNTFPYDLGLDPKSELVQFIQKYHEEGDNYPKITWP